MEHHGGLDSAAVDAVLHLGRREKPVRQAGAEPAAHHDEHLQPDPQVAGDDVHDLRLAAVAVEQDQLADTGAVDALADLGPDADQGFRRQRQGTGESLMLVGLADGHHRQNQDR